MADLPSTELLEREHALARLAGEDDLIESAQLGGATPLWRWIDEGATAFSY